MSDDNTTSGDSFSETSSEGFLSRLGSAITGVLIGIVLTIGAFPLLFWNEGRAVRTAKSLAEGRGAVVTVAPDRVDPANEGKLVHVSGTAKTGDTVADPVLGVSLNALRLKRNVEMYQWKETTKTEKKTNVGGGTETVTTYSYQKEWSASPIDSSHFKHPAEHQNSGTMPIKSETWSARQVTLGGYVLTAAQVEKIEGGEPVAANAQQASTALGRPVVENAGGLYAGDPATPKVGDLRISLAKVGDTAITVVSKQAGNSFQPYAAKAGSTVDLQQMGTVSADQMFTHAEESNTLLTWILRVAGWVLMGAGIGLILRPLGVLASVLPILGDIVEAGTGFVAFLLASALSMTTIAIAWIFYRPILGIALLVVGGGLAYGVSHLIRKAKAARPVPAPKPA